jgi:plasmid stabilization system protein ParE
VAWYETRSPQAARRFEAAAAAAIERIAARPKLYALADERHRLCPIRRSQYLIVYRYEPTNDEVIVIAAAHASQDPPAWQSRG